MGTGRPDRRATSSGRPGMAACPCMRLGRMHALGVGIKERLLKSQCLEKENTGVQLCSRAARRRLRDGSQRGEHGRQRRHALLPCPAQHDVLQPGARLTGAARAVTPLARATLVAAPPHAWQRLLLGPAPAALIGAGCWRWASHNFKHAALGPATWCESRVSAAPRRHQPSGRNQSSPMSACMSLALCWPHRMHGKGNRGWRQILCPLPAMSAGGNCAAHLLRGRQQLPAGHERAGPVQHAGHDVRLPDRDRRAQAGMRLSCPLLCLPMVRVGIEVVDMH